MVAKIDLSSNFQAFPGTWGDLGERSWGSLPALSLLKWSYMLKRLGVLKYGRAPLKAQTCSFSTPYDSKFALQVAAEFQLRRYMGWRRCICGGT